MATKDAVLHERWKRQDEELKLERDLRAQQLKALGDEERLAALQSETTIRMQRLQLEREAKVVEMERARAMRIAKEQAEEAMESAERSR